MSALAAENEFLRACCRSALATGEPAETLVAWLPKINWHHLFWLAVTHDVLWVLRATVKRPELVGSVPAEFREQFDLTEQAEQMAVLARLRELCQLQDLFDGDGIKVLILDPWWAVRIYGSPLVCGPFFLNFRFVLADSQRTAAEALLRTAGHPLDAGAEALVTPGSSPVRLKSLPDALLDRLKCFARETSVGGRKVYSPDPVAWLLQRLGHASGEQTLKLRNAWVDVLLARQIDVAGWAGWRRRAEELRVADLTVKEGELITRFEALGLPPPRDLVKPASPQTARRLPVRRLKAPFLPTPPAIARQMLEMAGTGPDDVVYDLGCGNGRIVIAAAREFGARGVGVDCDPVRIAEAQAAARQAGLSDRVAFVCGDLFTQDLSEATVVCLYLLPTVVAQLGERIRQAGRKGLRIVSHDYSFADWPPDRVATFRTKRLKVSHLYLWQKT